MAPQVPDIEQLLDRARSGDRRAVNQLLSRNRHRLRQMVAVWMDDRLSARIDPSDVVQEALTTAAARLPKYLQSPAIPFYPWLRRIAWNCLVDLHRHHVLADKRSVRREEPLGLSNTSAIKLADELLAGEASPIKRLLQKEIRARVRATLTRLSPRHREILILRYLEQLSGAECAAVLEISEKAANQRHLRAVQQLRRLLSDEISEWDS